MSYLKAFDILPTEVVAQIQKYIDGELIYIPRKEENKKSWGENTNTKEFITSRNRTIYLDYNKGMCTAQLSQKYFLTQKSIQRILREQNKK